MPLSGRMIFLRGRSRAGQPGAGGNEVLVPDTPRAVCSGEKAPYSKKKGSQLDDPDNKEEKARKER